MEHYVIAYDIKDDRRRSKIFNLLKSYATHVQYSIFETYITKEDITVLKYNLRRMIHTKEDSIFIYRQCSFCNSEIERLGTPINIYGQGDVII